MSVATPNLDHLTKADYEVVYDPAEDSFILLDALELDVEELQAGPAGRVVVEIGSGSGIVSSFIGSIVGGTDAFYIATDINPHAARCTHLTGLQNKVSVHPVLTNLVAALFPRLLRRIDLLVFNPPYVPTSLEEYDLTQVAQGIGSTWAGGADGMDLTSYLLTQLEDILSPAGIFYLVAIKQNKPLAILDRLRTTSAGRLDGKVALQRRAGGYYCQSGPVVPGSLAGS